MGFLGADSAENVTGFNVNRSSIESEMSVWLIIADVHLVDVAGADAVPAVAITASITVLPDPGMRPEHTWNMRSVSMSTCDPQ